MDSIAACGARLRDSLRDTLPLILFMLFFFCNAILGYFAIGNVAEEQVQATVSRTNIALIHSVIVEVLRAETGQRGYLLTGMDTYASPYHTALASIDDKLAALDAATLDAMQRQRFVELRRLVEQRMSELRSNVELLRDFSQREAVQELMSHRGQKLMTEIAALAAVMEKHEHRVLESRLQIANDKRNGAFFLILTANTVGLLLVAVSLVLVRTAQKKEKQYLVELKEAKEDLELKVEERTFALQHFSNELKRSNRELQDFAFVASHDLQEPLRKIRAFGDRLQQSCGERLGEQGADYVNRMQLASERMSRLINDLLSFSRITTKSEPFVSVALNDVANEVIEDLEVAIDEAGATIICGELPEVEADLFQMKQLLQNLIGNAIKFRRRDVPPVVTISAELPDPAHAGGQFVKLLFTDNGIGFDEAFNDRIFLPFQRLHGRSQYSGTGIGLAICRRVAERHGGSLTATSTPGIGSIFIVTLARTRQNFDFEEVA
ncbi:MAG: hypothetical protein RLZZ227_1980 [Pseudomonadota bacterium]|jgi:signal transduction histidine kinase